MSYLGFRTSPPRLPPKTLGFPWLLLRSRHRRRCHLSSRKRKNCKSHLSLLVLHSSPVDSVEKHLESPFGLRAVLNAEAEHHDLALASGKADDSGLALQALRAVSVAGDQHVSAVVGIPDDDRAMHVSLGRGSLQTGRPIGARTE